LFGLRPFAYLTPVLFGASPLFGIGPFSILATLALWKLNPRKWLTWYFEHCAAAGGRVPTDIQPFLPWNLSAEKRKSLGEPGLPEGDDTRAYAPLFPAFLRVFHGNYVVII